MEYRRLRELSTGLLLAASGLAQTGAGAAITAHVDGDPVGAIAMLEQQARTASDDVNLALLRQLAASYDRLGSSDETLASLERLAAEPGPVGIWARDELARRQPQDPESRTSALDQWVARLGGQKEARSYARQRLEELGELAIPALLAGVGNGPSEVGLEQILELIAPYDDDRVEQALRDMLASEDPVVQTLTAKSLRRMPRSRRSVLGRIAIRQPAAQVRVDGVGALLDLPDAREDVMSTLAELLLEANPAIRRRLPELLVAPAIRDDPRVAEWLAILAADEDAMTAESAIALRYEALETTRERIEFIRSLTDERAISLLASLWQHDAAADERVLLQILRWPDDPVWDWHQFDVDRRIDIDRRISSTTLLDNLDLVRLSLQARRTDRVQWAARFLARHQPPGFGALVEPLLTAADAATRDAALHYLAEVDPQRVVARADALIATQPMVVNVVARNGGVDGVPILARAVQAGIGAPAGLYHNSPYQQYPALAAIALHSTSAHLDPVLDIVALPGSETDAYGWSSRSDAALAALRRWFAPAHYERFLRRVWAIDSSVANAGMLAISERATSEHVEAIAEVLRAAVARGLRTYAIAAPALSTMPAPSLGIANHAIDALGHIGDARAATVLEGFCTEPNLEERAFRALLECDGDRAGWLRAALQDESRVRSLMVAVAHPAVAADQELSDLAVQRLLVVGEGQASRAGVGAFLSKLAADRRRVVAAKLLAPLESDQPCAEPVAIAALVALGDARDAELVPMLARGLRCASPAVRAESVGQLQRTFSRDAVPHLLDTLKDDDERVVANASAALQRLANYFEDREMWRQRLEPTGEDR